MRSLSATPTGVSKRQTRRASSPVFKPYARLCRTVQDCAGRVATFSLLQEAHQGQGSQRPLQGPLKVENGREALPHSTARRSECSEE